MKKLYLLRTAALLVAITVMFSSLSGCVRKKQSEDDLSEPVQNTEKIEKTAPKGVFSVSYPETDIGSNTWIQYAASVNDDIYLAASYYNEVFVQNETDEADAADVGEKTDAIKDVSNDVSGNSENSNAPAADESTKIPGEYKYENGISLIKITPDGKAEIVKSFANSYSFDDSDKSTELVSYSAVMPTNDGGTAVLMKRGSDGKAGDVPVYTSETILVKYAPDGSEMPGINVSSALLALCENGIPKSDLAIDRFFFCPDASVLLCGDRITAVISENGELISGNGFAGNVRLGNFVQLPDGAVVGISYTYDSEAMADVRKIIKIDPRSATVSEIGNMPFADAYSIYPSSKDDSILVSGNSALYLYNIENGTLTEYINWLNSDINPNRITVHAQLSDSRVVASENTQDYTETRLSILSPVKRPAKKYAVTLGSVLIDDDMTEAIIGFNKKSEDTRIFYKDYSVFNTEENGELGKIKLLEDIEEGVAPDIVSLVGLDCDEAVLPEYFLELSQHFPREQYAEKCFENVLYYSDNGIYSLIPSFTVETLAGKKEIFGEEPLTVKRLLEISKKYPRASIFGNVTRGELLDAFVRLAANSFSEISEDGNTGFASEDFIEILKLIKGYPGEINWNSFYEGMTEKEYHALEYAYAENRTLIAFSYIGKFAFAEREKRFGDKITFVGFPTIYEGNSGIKPRAELAICKNSKKQRLALDFFEYLLSEEGASKLLDAFSVNKAVNSKMAKNSLEESYGQTAENSAELSFDDVPFTAEDADEILRLIKSSNTVIRKNTATESIVRKYAESFFNSEISASDAANRINSEILLLINNAT